MGWSFRILYVDMVVATLGARDFYGVVSGFSQGLQPMKLLITREKKPLVPRVGLGVVLTTIKSVTLEERGCVRPLVLKAPPVDPPVIIFL